jgi:hypothetical protein
VAVLAPLEAATLSQTNQEKGSTMNEKNLQLIAKTCHEANRAYCQSIGDNSQPSWEDAPDWQKDSAINGVKFHLANPGATPENSHECWMAQKVQEGWVFGPEKNPEKKEHPCMVPYNELPQEQRSKDYIFRSIIHAMASLADEE